MCGAFQQEDDNKLDREAVDRMKDAENIGVIPVSYTHLTLPTKRIG